MSIGCLKLIDTHAGARRASADKARRTRKGVTALRVLLIEDNAALAEATAEMLRQQGLEVAIAHSGREALDSAPAFRPQLILCDLHLPDMAGMDVVKRLRSIASTRRSRVVILTALGDSELHELRRRRKELEVDNFLSKPLKADTIRKLMAELMPAQRGAAK